MDLGDLKVNLGMDIGPYMRAMAQMIASTQSGSRSVEAILNTMVSNVAAKFASLTKGLGAGSPQVSGYVQGFKAIENAQNTTMAKMKTSSEQTFTAMQSKGSTALRVLGKEFEVLEAKAKKAYAYMTYASTNTPVRTGYYNDNNRGAGFGGYISGPGRPRNDMVFPEGPSIVTSGKLGGIYNPTLNNDARNNPVPQFPAIPFPTRVKTLANLELLGMQAEMDRMALGGGSISGINRLGPAGLAESIKLGLSSGGRIDLSNRRPRPFDFATSTQTFDTDYLLKRGAYGPSYWDRAKAFGSSAGSIIGNGLGHARNAGMYGLGILGPLAAGGAMVGAGGMHLIQQGLSSFSPGLSRAAGAGFSTIMGGGGIGGLTGGAIGTLMGGPGGGLLGSAIGGVAGTIGGTVLAPITIGVSLLTDGLTSAISLTKELVSSTVMLGMEYERSKTAFQVLTGNKADGDNLLAGVKKYAIESPYESRGLTKVTESLLGMGVSGSSTLPVLQRLGDVAAGDQEKLHRLAIAYGQVMAAGNFRGEELRQFTNAGVGVEDFAQTAGKSTAEFRAAMETMQIPASVVAKTINRLTDAGGRFAGMSKEVNKTVGGQWNSLKETITNLLEQVGLKLFKEFDVSGKLGGVSKWLKGLFDSNIDSGIEKFVQLLTVFTDIKDAALGLGDAIASSLKEFIGFVSSMSKGDAEKGVKSFVVALIDGLESMSEIGVAVFKDMSVALLNFTALLLDNTQAISKWAGIAGKILVWSARYNPALGGSGGALIDIGAAALGTDGAATGTASQPWFKAAMAGLGALPNTSKGLFSKWRERYFARAGATANDRAMGADMSGTPYRVGDFKSLGFDSENNFEALMAARPYRGMFGGALYNTIYGAQAFGSEMDRKNRAAMSVIGGFGMAGLGLGNGSLPAIPMAPEMSAQAKNAAMEVRKSFEENFSPMQSFDRLRKNLSEAAGNPGLNGLIGGMGGTVVPNAIINGQQKEFGMYNAYQTLRDSVKNRITIDDKMSGGFQAGSAEAQDIVNRSNLTRMSKEDEMIAVFKEAVKMEQEQRDEAIRLRGVVEKLERSGFKFASKGM